MRDDGARRRGGRPHAFDDGCIIRAGRDHVPALHRELLDARRLSQRLDLEAQVSVDLVFRGSFELHVFESVPVAEQLEVLPRREEKHRHEEEAQPHRAPHLALPVAIDLAHDGIVPYILLDRVFERFGRHTESPCRRRATEGTEGTVSTQRNRETETEHTYLPPVSLSLRIKTFPSVVAVPSVFLRFPFRFRFLRSVRRRGAWRFALAGCVPSRPRSGRPGVWSESSDRRRPAARATCA